jgi:hypothetical protein
MATDRVLRIVATVSAILLAIAGGATVHADVRPLVFWTPPLPLESILRGNRGTGQPAYLFCNVEATSATPIGVVAKIVSRDGTNVTDFGSGYRASPAAADDGLYHATETAGSIDERA